MTESQGDLGELRPSYRTLNEPTRLLGLSLASWATVILAGAAAYAFVGLSPLPWRLNFSAVVIGLGGPVLLLILREPGTIGPGRLLAAVLLWRTRPVDLTAPSDDQPLRRGAVRLDAALTAALPSESSVELPWTDDVDRRAA